MIFRINNKISVDITEHAMQRIKEIYPHLKSDTVLEKLRFARIANGTQKELIKQRTKRFRTKTDNGYMVYFVARDEQQTVFITESIGNGNYVLITVYPLYADKPGWTPISEKPIIKVKQIKERKERKPSKFDFEIQNVTGYRLADRYK